MTRFRLAAVSAACCLAMLSSAGAVIPDAAGHTPVLGAETVVGSIARAPLDPQTPSAKTVDGDPSDWTGEITRIGGSAIYSRGEYVYQDYLMDDWGADDGYDADRLEAHDQLQAIEPRTYRNDALQQAAGAQFGADRPVGAELHYGDANPGALKDQADIEEARLAADGYDLYVLVRTTGMTANPATAVLVLLDTVMDANAYAAPGGVTSVADWAVLVAGDRVLSLTYQGTAYACADCVTVATNAAGYTNAVELSIDRAMLGALERLSVGIATGVVNDTANPTGLASVKTGDAVSDLINVAFRHEPARIWMDREQALALRTGTVDRFLARVDVDKLEAGWTETFQQRPGYYERIYEAFATDGSGAESKVNQETESNSYYQGHFQHYGVYLPTTYSPGRVMPATFWMHYRGGHAHDAAAWLPGVMRNFGDDVGTIVVTPSARGESSWYTGRGMEDFLSVWEDVLARYSIDEDRVDVAGHSMGGWASNFLGLLLPDRWAAANPEDGLLCPCLWPGVGDPTGAQNGADIQAEFVYKIIGNARNIPYAILHGTEDELVPVSGAIAQGQTLHDLGYRYRTYLYHTYEHYSAPIWDDWREIVRYMSQFRRNPNPPHVTYSTWPALDHAVSTISVPSGVDLGYTFNAAYWVSDVATATPGRAYDNIGTIDATTYGRGFDEYTGVPEAGTGGGPEAYTMHGQTLIKTGSVAPQNRFIATLTNVGNVSLDMARMGLSTMEPLTFTITTDEPATVRLKGNWPQARFFEVSGGLGFPSYHPGELRMTFSAAGTYNVLIIP